MKVTIVAVRDIVADVFHAPVFAQNEGSAKRSFTDQCRNKDTLYGQHPEDYELYHLGYYDDQNASFELNEEPRQICIGKSALQ